MTAIELIEYYNIGTLSKVRTLLEQGRIDYDTAEIIAGIILDC